MLRRSRKDFFGAAQAAGINILSIPREKPNVREGIYFDSRCVIVEYVPAIWGKVGVRLGNVIPEC